jgi:hypothetical protein
MATTRISDNGLNAIGTNEDGVINIPTLNGITHTKKVTLTSSDILSSGDTPVVIIDSPGEGKFIQLLGCNVIYNYGENTYLFNVDPSSLYYTNNDLNPISNGFTILQQNSPETYYSSISPLGNGFKLNNFIDASVVFATDVNPTNGDGSMDVYITYTIISM